MLLSFLANKPLVAQAAQAVASQPGSMDEDLPEPATTAQQAVAASPQVEPGAPAPTPKQQLQQLQAVDDAEAEAVQRASAEHKACVAAFDAAKAAEHKAREELVLQKERDSTRSGRVRARSADTASIRARSRSAPKRQDDL